MLRIKKKDAVTSLILDRPERRNALNVDMIGALSAALARADADVRCRCVVIKGAGDHFCSGRELAAGGRCRDLDAVLAYDDAYCEIFQRLQMLSKPSVAVVRGYAVAGGFTLAMACDFVLAEENAKFGALEMKNGFPAAVNTAVLSHLIGRRRALELLLLGDIATARELFEFGLINRMAPNVKALAEVESAFVLKLAALDALAVRLTKETQRAVVNMPLSDALAVGKQLNALLMASGRIDEAARSHASRRRRN
ncbi:MAG: enoyl-CoA hydratase/isomerase family protein [Pseudomonadota bacterium]